MNLHFVPDEKFINGAIDQFEAYYPNQNIFVLNRRVHKNQFLKERKELISLDIHDKRAIHRLIEQKGVKNVFLHYLGHENAEILFRIGEETSLNYYWVFFGGDLYELLNRVKNYPLYDQPLTWSNFVKTVVNNPSFFINEVKKRIRKYVGKSQVSDSKIVEAIKMIDYFCFWNEQDYWLLKEHFYTKAKYKPFIYSNVLDTGKKVLQENRKDKFNLLINHSASKTGNHLTILQAITKDIEDKLDKIVLPLNYGNTQVKTLVLTEGKRFREKFNPLLDFLPLDEYYGILNSIDCAVFGMQRQEAGGNLLFLLNNGVKIFLRKKNNLLDYFRSLGFIVYCFEEDFTANEIAPLTLEEKEHNRQIYQAHFSQENISKMMKNLLVEIA